MTNYSSRATVLCSPNAIIVALQGGGPVRIGGRSFGVRFRECGIRA
jgi:hypothetical protein